MPHSVPTEIWQLIAARMDLKDWAKASGTCKASWELQLDEIWLGDEQYDTEGEGFSCARAAWVLKRAHRAQKLRFGPLKGRRKITSMLLQAGKMWTSLRSLDLIHYEKWSGPFDHADCCTALAWLLGCAPEITFLRLVIRSLPCVPCLSQLCHLQIESKNVSDMAASLGALSNLRTLYIKDLSRSPASKSIPLDLSGLEHLRSVMLDQFVPSSMSLALGTELHVRTRDWHAGHSFAGMGVLQALHSLHFDVSLEITAREASDLLECLVAATNLRVLTIKAKSLGSNLVPIALTGAFLQAERLGLHADDIFVKFPAGNMPWKEIQITSNELGVSFASMTDFAHSCKVFYFAWRNLQGRELMHLHHLLADLCCGWSEDKELGMCHFYRSCKFRSLCYGVKLPGRFCECGACTICSDKGSCGPDAQFHARRLVEC